MKSAPRVPPPAEGWLNSNGIRMHYLDWGGAGPPLVALHGLASSCHWYDLVLPHIADGFRCIALDQRAHGLSDQPSSGYDWSTLAADVIGALDQMRFDRVALVGHSWGSSVALNTAALHPDRVARLILVDGGFFDGRRLLPGTTWESYKARLRPRDIYGPRERYLRALKEELAGCWNREIERIVMTMVRMDPDGTVHERLEPGNHEQVLRAMWDEPPSAAFPRLQCPTLIVAAAPKETPENAPFLQRRRDAVAASQSAIRDCTVQWIQDSAHDIGYYKPRELAIAIRSFLADRLGSQK